MIEILVCLVVGITDGDTLKARCGERGAYNQVTVRLAEIDAPESGQAFGKRARASLATLCFGTWARIEAQKRDKYGRTVARVQCRGLDASAEQVRAGMAWHYRAYATDAAFADLELSAQSSRLGLWADATPVPPWEWRAARQGAKASTPTWQRLPRFDLQPMGGVAED